MITQIILNWLRDVMVSWLQGLPPVPDVLYDAREFLVDGGAVMNDYAEKFGVVVPWNTIGTLLTTWLALLAFWVVAVAVRAVLWALNR